jgi:putative transposase
VHWYNFNHQHSGIRYVSPAQRHAGEDRLILAQRHPLYLQARERNPARWSRHTRNWEPIGAVALNPERPGSTPSASFGLSFACATNQINNLQQARQIV